MSNNKYIFFEPNVTFITMHTHTNTPTGFIMLWSPQQRSQFLDDRYGADEESIKAIYHFAITDISYHL